MRPVRILADDLTGALDSAGCFAGAQRPLPVVFDPAHLPKEGNCAVSTESRDVTESEAVRRIERCAHMFDNQDGIAFKKIDSLLRGHVAAEIAALARRGGFQSVVIAPAFPALDRVTRGGRQWAMLAGDERPRMVGADLASDFARFGIDVEPGLADIARRNSPRVFLADAQTDDDLRMVVNSGGQAGRVLWCGSAGLANILADARNEPVPVVAKRMLVICGTRHPVASLQLERLCDNDRSAVVSLQPGYDADAAIAAVNGRLRDGRFAALAAEFPQMDPEAARVELGAIAKIMLPKLDRPDALFVMGGDTLQICCEALGAHRLSVRGLLAPGIAVSQFADGTWAGLTVISKSGAFGSAQTLCDIVAMAGEGQSIRSRQKVPHH